MALGIHNILEDVVLQVLDELLAEYDDKDLCKCDQCRTDVIYYALNKLKPMYIVSSRGMVHYQNDKRDTAQTDIDIYMVVKEAIDLISKRPRHNHLNLNDSVIDAKRFEYKNMFLFPIIYGRILDARDFSIVTDVEVILRDGESKELVQMISPRWTNPSELVKQMDGSYTFWPAPIEAKRLGIQKEFTFCLELRKEGYETMFRYFELTTASLENNEMLADVSCNFHNLEDIYIFSED